jgi:hypothetical protein
MTIWPPAFEADICAAAKYAELNIQRSSDRTFSSNSVG